MGGGAGTILCGDGDAMDHGRVDRTVRVGDGVRGTRAKGEQGQVGLDRYNESKGCTRVPLTDRVAKVDGAAKVAIDLDASGSTCEQDLEEAGEGRGDMHGREHTEEERVVNTVKGLGCVREDKDPGETNTVSVVYKVLYITAVREA